MGWVAAGVAVAGLAGSAVTASAVGSAADTQANATTAAADKSQQNFQSTQANLQPFVSAGTNALTKIQDLTGTNPGGNPLTAPLTAPFQPTLVQLEGTPGYQFTLDQGLKATQNSYAAQGLGTSGASQKGAINYAEGLAGTTYQQQFQNYLNQNQQIYNMLGGISGSGQNAAAGLGSLSLNNTNSINALTTSGAAAQAAGTVGTANAISGGLSGAGNNALLYGILGNSGMFGGATGGNAFSPATPEG